MLCPTCGATNEPTAENCFGCGRGLFAVTEGAVLSGRYEILRPLGRGGMGMVYQAVDRELDEVVALKVLQPALARSPEIAHRFRSEIKLARKVRHPNVCAIHEYGQDGNRRFIVMEYVQGQDLKRVLREKRTLFPHEAYELSMQIASGLHAIHQVGVVHRDLKTSNIMLDTQGAVRLMDFGLAKLYEGDSSGPTRTGDVVGTPEYMSPEQARAAHIDARADVYALGIVIFELFTGTVPFRGETPVITMLKHLHDEPLEGPAAARLPAQIRPLLAHMLAKDREQRLPSCQEVLEALRLARSHLIEPVTPVDGGSIDTAGPADVTKSALRAAPEKARAPARRGLWLGLAALAAGAGLAGWWLPRLGAPAPPPAGPEVAAAPSAAPAVTAAALVPPPPRAAARSLPGPRPPSGAAPAPPAAPSPSAAEVVPAAGPGLLRVVVRPYADVSVDGKPVGTSPPLPPLPLASGSHTVYLTHPSYRPLARDVVIRPGEATRLEVDLAREGVRK